MKKYNYCINCGFKLFPDNQFCPNCGVRVGHIKGESSINEANLRNYRIKINELKDKYEEKEFNVKELIVKRFQPPQMTYYRFMNEIDNCRIQFYKQVESATSILDLIENMSPNVEAELNNRINNLEAIIEKVDQLTEELILNISDSENKSSEEIKQLMQEMGDLIDSIKDYK
ncbi:zinc ribbon domain-containing protein [uncultured Methanobrevibacter sp.]|uniref:zinc ribbon domain-containing protein n=1 Tax=uncultured Methanobrevibacter sp. TaxID=253161 RepID=UPI0026365E71